MLVKSLILDFNIIKLYIFSPFLSMLTKTFMFFKFTLEFEVNFQL